MIQRPLLAAKTTDADLQNWKRWPMLLSPKIDGVRALIIGNEVRSRSMKLIPNLHTQFLFGREAFHGLDGELVVGQPTDKNLMQQTTSGVMTRLGQPNVTYWVFDNWARQESFNLRLNFAGWQQSSPLGVKLVPHVLVESYEEMLEYERHYLAMGYEGVMLRDPAGRYKQNRSTLKEGILLKVKRFHDAEAEVLDYEALERNLNAKVLDERGYAKRSSHQDNKVADEMLGSLLVRDLDTGVIFKVGSGFTEGQRQHLWDHRSELKGKIVKYKSLPVGVKDKPRHPIFLGFRSLIDL